MFRRPCSSYKLSRGISVQDEQLDLYIDRLRFAAMEVLMRLSRRFQRKRQGTIFLITNLTHVAQVCLQGLGRSLASPCLPDVFPD